jgi:hypothetical protein
MTTIERPVIGFLTDFGLDGAAATCRAVMLRLDVDRSSLARAMGDTGDHSRLSITIGEHVQTAMRSPIFGWVASGATIV